MYADERDAPQLRTSRHASLDHGTPLDASDEARDCTADGCTTVLSRYNPSETCSQHRGWVDKKTRSYG